MKGAQQWAPFLLLSSADWIIHCECSPEVNDVVDLQCGYQSWTFWCQATTRVPVKWVKKRPPGYRRIQLPVALLILKLGAVQLGVSAFLRQQFVVAASFDNFTLVQYQDLIGVFDGAQAMGDDNGRTVF